MLTPILLATVFGLGVHAPAANELIVLVNGKETRVQLAGVPTGNDAAREFVRCLTNKRVLRVDAAHGRAWLLDNRLVSDYVNEFLGTKTAADPCSIGRAAYTPQTPTVAAAAAAASAGKTSSGHADVGTVRSSSGKEIHVSFGSGKQSPDNLRVPEPERYDQAPRAPVMQAPREETPAVQRPQVIGTTTIPVGSTTTPSTVGTQTINSGSTTTVNQGNTYEPPKPGTVAPPVTKPPV